MVIEGEKRNVYCAKAKERVEQIAEIEASGIKRKVTWLCLHRHEELEPNIIKCIKCNSESDKVGVESKATQYYDLEAGEYGELEAHDTIGLFCWNCGENFTNEQRAEVEKKMS